jgi:hypothetical protein
MMTNHPNRKAKAERAVLVTTAHRGVFFGYAKDTGGASIATKGFLGLAATGPIGECRVGPPADIELRDITCVAECTAEAVKAWEAAPWK